MAKRDDFTSATRTALAKRAGYICSMCRGPTIGPSAEEDTKSADVGTAAHICAAAPGGKRYDPNMTSEERKHISNGIWLCNTHGKLIDSDEETYTVAELHKLKARHEAFCSDRLSGSPAGEQVSSSLIAFGPGIVADGRLTEVVGDRWGFELEHFVSGSFSDLVAMSGNLAAMQDYDRYIIVNELDEGRSIAGELSVRRENNRTCVSCRVSPAPSRKSAHLLGRDLALGPNHDLCIVNGDIATVSGLDALPQRISSNLSLRRGERPFNPAYGSRLAEYWELYLGSPWLGELLKMEVIRLASIPYRDAVLPQQSPETPLACVEKVHQVVVLGEIENNRLPVRLDLQVAGVGKWTRETAVYIACGDDRPVQPANWTAGQMLFD